MRRRVVVVVLAAVAALGLMALPANAIIHEIVASHCSPQAHTNPNILDPPGQLNQQGNSFARALQATGVYDIQFGEAQTGQFGFDVESETLGPLPGPAVGTVPVSVFVDNTQPSAKLGDFLFWVRFVEPDAGLTVYLQIYELDHPAFEHCANFHD